MLFILMLFMMYITGLIVYVWGYLTWHGWINDDETYFVLIIFMFWPIAIIFETLMALAQYKTNEN